MNFKPGLYRHFDGTYYLFMNLMKGEQGNYVQYIDVLNPQMGYFYKPLDECWEDVSERKDNYTGQLKCFELVTNLDNVVKNASTEQLVNELRKRVDSPFQSLDIDGLNECVFCSDYVVGMPYEASECSPKGVDTLNVFDTAEEAWEYLSSRKFREGTTVFKRTFIEEEHF